MNLNESKRTQKNPKYVNKDPIWAQNGPKWTQMSKPKNELKGAQVTSNELQWAQNVPSFAPNEWPYRVT